MRVKKFGTLFAKGESPRYKKQMGRWHRNNRDRKNIALARNKKKVNGSATTVAEGIFAP